ncbi:hypothetical protein [Alkaliphilus metalliredigens]|uniref:hypothetical protein n=1 Tax=Alkaliphilus metalliredigens TaxID=208226 RepID=UPI0002F37856|nr:hypothetical protein [Alkaliphilus metalliredigens]
MSDYIGFLLSDRDFIEELQEERRSKCEKARKNDGGTHETAWLLKNFIMLL